MSRVYTAREIDRIRSSVQELNSFRRYLDMPTANVDRTVQTYLIGNIEIESLYELVDELREKANSKQKEREDALRRQAEEAHVVFDVPQETDPEPLPKLEEIRRAYVEEREQEKMTNGDVVKVVLLLAIAAAFAAWMVL